MTALDHGRGAPPLYAQIYRALKEDIARGVYGRGDTLPTEGELQARFQVSRITVRQAMQGLEQEGLIRRTRGKGTVVAGHRIAEVLPRIRSFTDEMRERHMTPGTRSVQVARVMADEKLARVFGCDPGTVLCRVRRVRTADGRPIVLFDTWLRAAAVMPEEPEAYTGSLYQLMEERGIPKPAGVMERFEAVAATAEVAEALDVPVGASVMRGVRVAYDAAQRVQEYTLSCYDGAGYAYVVYVGSVPGEGGAEP